MERKFTRFLGYVLALIILLTLRDVFAIGGLLLVCYALFTLLMVLPLSRDQLRRRIGWAPSRNATVILAAIWLGTLMSPLFENKSNSGNSVAILGPEQRAQESEKKCRLFVENYGVGRIGKQKSRRDDQICEVFDKKHSQASDVYIESLQVSVTFLGSGLVMFGNFHRPEMPSVFQQDQGFEEIWGKALSAAGLVGVPKFSEVSTLYMRMGNIGKVTKDSINFEAKDCFGEHLISISVSDNTPFAQSAGVATTIQESIGVEQCPSGEAQKVKDAKDAVRVPVAEEQGKTQAARPTERFADNLDGTVKDNQTGLIWAGQDNGRDINWIDAKDYCAAKGAGWHLPTVDQLTAIYDESLPLVSCGFMESTAVSCHVSERFKLSGPTFWSSVDHVPAQAWYVLLTVYGGSSGTEHIEHSVMRRALCLRSP